MSLEFQFGTNLSKTIDLSRENIREYFREDFKYLIKPIVTLFLSLLVFFVLLMFPIGYNVSVSPSIIYLIVVVFLFVILFSILWFSYIVTWLMASKAYHTITKYSKPKQGYAESLRETIGARFRVFLGSTIANLVVLAVVIIVYVGLFLLVGTLIIAIPYANFGTIIILLMLMVIVLALVAIYLVFRMIPLQLYPTVLIMEREEGYGSGFKRTFDIMPGWKNKIKFFFAQAILSYLVSFVAQFVLFAFIFGAIFVFFFVVLVLNLNGLFAILLFIITDGLLFGIYFIGLVEAENIVLGTFHGQSYINLVKPEFMDVDVNYQKYQSSYTTAVQPNAVYCTNCGQLLTSEQNFCPACGQPVKAK